MHLEPDSQPFGVDVHQLQHAACELRKHDRAIELEDVRSAFAATKGEGKQLITQMVQEGYLTPYMGKRGYYELAGKFSQLCLAKISNGLPRAKADALLDKILRKAHELNASVTPEDCHVDCIVVFGSYVTTNKTLLGDLDIGVALRDPQNECKLLSTEDLSTWLRRSKAPYRRAEAALRLRQPDKISIHTLEEVLRLKTPYRVVFRELPAKTSADTNDVAAANDHSDAGAFKAA